MEQAVWRMVGQGAYRVAASSHTFAGVLRPSVCLSSLSVFFVFCVCLPGRLVERRIFFGRLFRVWWAPFYTFLVSAIMSSIDGYHVDECTYFVEWGHLFRRVVALISTSEFNFVDVSAMFRRVNAVMSTIECNSFDGCTHWSSECTCFGEWLQLLKSHVLCCHAHVVLFYVIWYSSPAP